MATYIAGAGGGGKGGGGSARVAVEAPNTLKSKSYAKIVEVLCEGEIQGIVGGAQGIYLDGTPLQNADGSFNYEDVVVETREGTLLQGITRIGATTESTSSIGTEIKKDVPVLHTIANSDVDRARVLIRVPALSSQNTSNGDLNGTEVRLLVEYNPNGAGWIQAPVGSSTFPLSPSYFTGVSYISGAVVATSLFTTETYCTGREGNNCKTVKRFSPSTLVLQFNENNNGWVTFGGTDFTGQDQTIPFNLAVSKTASYQIRAVFSSGSGIISHLNGSAASGEVTISGKTTSPYEREVEFSLTGSAPWIIRVTRLTDDSVSSALQNKTYLSSITSIFEEKFRYPATAYVALSIDAEQFSSIPTRAYDVKLLKIRVPTNYDPIARTYTGVWDGTFKIEWSDNPAWCFYDLIINKRYGLGERIEASQIDKWELYDIAQYCDELVDNGDGVLEPRFTCNVLIQTREEAYKVLQDMASIFAGITYWGSTSDGFQGIIPVQDKPEDSVSYIFNNSSVVDGVFSYQTANSATQYNAVYVTYNDPSDEYKQKVVYVGDDEAIAQDEFVNDTNIVAFGCTSRAQAVRLGRRVLFANRYENDVVTFSTGADGIVPQIGSIIKVSDELRSGERRDGRVVEKLSNTSVEIDLPFTFISGTAYKLSFIKFDATVIEVDVTTTDTTSAIVEFTPALTDAITKNTPFIISDIGLEAELFKVVSVSETDQHTYAVSAVKHIPDKYGYIDDLVNPTLADTSNLTFREPVTDVSASEVLYLDGVTIRSKLTVSWKAARFSSLFRVSYNINSGNTTVVDTIYPSLDILNTERGTYSISIVSIDILGTLSAPATSTFQVLGKLSPPAVVEDFSINAFANAANASWKLHPDLDVNIGGFIDIRHTGKISGYTWEDGSPVARVSGNATSAIIPLLAGTYMAKAVDASGIYSTSASFADSSFAQLQQLNVVATDVQQPSWAGAKTNVGKVGNVITLLSDGTMDDVVMLFDELTSVDLLDFSVLSSGEYEFDNYIDIGEVAASRVTSTIEYLAYDLADLIDSRTELIDSWVSFDGSVINSSYVTLFISTTQDDPSGMSAVWTEWKSFIVADYKARGFKFKLVFTNPIPTNNIDVSKAEISIDMPDRVVGEDNILCPVGGYSVVYSAPFYIKPSVAIRIDNMQQGDWWEIINNTAAGFDIKFRNSSGTYVSRQFDYISKGYGYIFI